MVMYKCKQKYLVKGFTLPEMMIATAIVIFLVGSVFLLMSSAQNSFFYADASIDVRNQVRKVTSKLTYELRQTGYDASNQVQFTISDNTGVSASDILTFSIPVMCTSTMTSILSSNGIPAFWGAPLTWGCSSSSCMDQNDSCAVQEYKYVRYILDASGDLKRQVLSSTNQVVSESTLGNNFTNFQVGLGGNGRLLTITLSAQKQAATKRVVSVTVTQKIMVANYGT